MVLSLAAIESLKRTARTQRGHVTRRADALERAIATQSVSPTSFGFSECKRIFKDLEAMVAQVSTSYDKLLIEDDVGEQDTWEKKNNEVHHTLTKLRDDMQGCVSHSTTAGVTAAVRAQPQQQQGILPGQIINDTLKPSVLSLENKPIELRQWVREIKTFFMSNQLDKVSQEEQIGYCRKFLAPELEVLVSAKVDDHTTFDGDNNSILSIVQEEFNIRYPLFERRLEYFQFHMQQGQSATAFVARKLQLAQEADLPSLQVDDLNCFTVMTGLKDDGLLSKLLDLSTPTFEDIKKRIAKYESTKASKKACAESAKAAKVQLNQKFDKSAGQTRQPPQYEGMITPWFLEGKCNKCASTKHLKDRCDKENPSCSRCKKSGHLASACLGDYFKYREQKGGPRRQGNDAAGARPKQQERARQVDGDRQRETQSTPPASAQGGTWSPQLDEYTPPGPWGPQAPGPWGQQYRQ